jgi:WD40 repeat protein
LTVDRSIRRYRKLRPRQSDHCALSADGRLAATGSTGGLVHLWNGDDGKAILPGFRMAGDGVGVSFSPDGRLLLAWGTDGSARVWEVGGAGGKADSYDFEDGAAHRSGSWPGLEKDEWHVYSPDGKSRLIARGNTATLTQPGRPDVSLAHDQTVLFAQFSATGRHMLICTAKALVVWELGSTVPTGPPILLRAEPSRPPHMCDDGGRIAGHLKDETGWVWDVRTGQALLGPLGGQPRQKDSPDAVDPLFALAPDGQFAAFKMGLDSATRVRVFALDAGRHFDTPPHSFVPLRPEFGRDGRRVLIAGSDTIARIWDTATGQPAGPPLRHPTFVRNAALGPDGRRVATVAADRVLRVWDGETGDSLIPVMPSPFASNMGNRELWFSDTGREILWRPLSGAVTRVPLRSFRPPREMVRPLLRLLSAQELDVDTNGLVPLQNTAYGDNPENYLQAWRAWQGR